MNEAFEKIDIEKKDRIINSAFEEFSKYGFDKASTNNIVKNANISKGLLFHYFNNKKSLFEYLEQFSVETILRQIEDDFDWNETDIFERIKQAAVIKIKITERYPHIFSFCILILENKTREEMLNMNEGKAIKLISQIYNFDVDYTKFKEDIDIKKAMTIIKWTFDKYGEECVKRFEQIDEDIDYDQILEEIESYIEVLRVAFYK